MKSLIAQALLALALAIAAAACGDSGKLKLPDGGTTMPDAPPDGSMQATLTSYVIDLVQNQTANNTAARPYSEFQSLPDPDGSNGSAYSSLFP